jgi:hypothetical protein
MAKHEELGQRQSDLLQEEIELQEEGYSPTRTLCSI